MRLGTLVAILEFSRPDTEQIDLPIVQSLPFRVPETLTVRVRLLSITPQEPSVIRWRHGGEGQGGEVIRGVFPRIGIVPDTPAEAHALSVGQWSGPVQLASFAERFSEKFFLTITAGNPSRTVDRKTGRLGGNSTDVIFEFEFRFGGEVIKTFVAKGPEGGTATIVVPVYRLVGGVGPRLAEAIVAFLDNPKRFKNSKQVGSYVGLRTR